MNNIKVGKIMTSLILLFSISFMSELKGELKDSYMLGWRFAINNNDKLIAFTYSPIEKPDRGYPEPDFSKIKVGLLDLKKDLKFKTITEAELILPLKWHPVASPPELFISRTKYYVSLFGSSSKSFLSSVIINEDQIIKTEELLHKKISIMNMEWNPDGSVLAFNISSDRLFKKGRFLGVSYDDGKNIIITDIIFRTFKMVWTNPETLYIANGGKILEIDVSNKSPHISKEVFSGEIDKVRLFGQIEGKIIFRSGNDIYSDSSLLYRSEQNIINGELNKNKIGFKTKDHIFVIDSKGNLIDKKDFDRSISLFGISDAQNCIYLSNNQLIQRYNYINKEIKTLFDISSLN